MYVCIYMYAQHRQLNCYALSGFFRSPPGILCELHGYVVQLTSLIVIPMYNCTIMSSVGLWGCVDPQTDKSTQLHNFKKQEKPPELTRFVGTPGKIGERWKRLFYMYLKKKSHPWFLLTGAINKQVSLFANIIGFCQISIPIITTTALSIGGNDQQIRQNKLRNIHIAALVNY